MGGFALMRHGIGIALSAENDALLRATLYTASGTASLVFNELLKQESFYRQMGVDADVQTTSDGNKIIAALIGGSGDMCAGSGFSSLFPAIAKGAKIKIIAGAATSPVTCLFSKRPDIKSAKDLIGRTVGIGAPGALVHEMVVALLIKKGLDYTKVTFVNIGSTPDIFKAVVAGTVDAGSGEVEVYDQQEKYGVHALTDGAFWDALPEYTIQAMFASDRAIAEKREVLVRCLAAASQSCTASFRARIRRRLYAKLVLPRWVSTTMRKRLHNGSSSTSLAGWPRISC